MSNDVEDKAIEFTMTYERQQSRTPKRVKNVGYDIESDNRQIEVKGLGGKNGFVLLGSNNVKALQKEKNYWLYIVRNIKSKPEFLMLNKMQAIERAKFEIQWVIPLWESDFKK